MTELTHWHWWIIAVALIVLEIFAPGTFFLWMGVSAGIVGGLVYVAPSIGWEYQLLVFSILSVASIVTWRRFFRSSLAESDQPALNRRGSQYIGRVLTLDDAIINGQGRVRLDDTVWRVRGKDVPSGARVRVVQADGTVLVIEPVDLDVAQPSARGETGGTAYGD